MPKYTETQAYTSQTNNSGRDFALLIGGVAAGILGSRLFPPLIAMATGAARARRSDDPFDLLIADHRTIMTLLREMEQTPAESTLRRGTLYLKLKRKLAKHALAEEDVVYPILHNQADDPSSSKDLYDDHAAIKIHLFELEQKLSTGEDWRDNVRPLRELIEHHIHEEETDVFPRLRRMFDEGRMPVISGQISREESLIL